ncbi:MAG TPA: serine/threonine-protein kinase [Gemmatimonadales bacterium]|jgi:serine/threonine-protein kinase
MTSTISEVTGGLADRYRVHRELGQGGMATVYLADDLATGAPVAIKVLHPNLTGDPVSMARLQREADLGRQLAHPNLCHILAFGRAAGGFDYIVMPFLDGELLCDRVGRGGPLPLDDAVPVVCDVAAGLHVAHDLEIVHRDLKPENIMLVRNENGSERAVVIDFGLATGRQPGMQRLTKTGMVVGTPDFMSPEQIRGKSLDRRSDIYSLAFITYEMLTGELPFLGESMRDLAIARLKGELIPLRIRRPDLHFPESVDKVIAKALAVELSARYATAPEFATALLSAARTDTGPGRRLLRWMGR